VNKKVIRKDPNRTLLPGFLVSAVVIEPWGAHPSPVQGYYGRDHEKYITYHLESRDRNEYLKWLAKWVVGVTDRKDYLRQVGEERIKSLTIKCHKKSMPVDYGY
jgi:glutaconate CoA-transferase subunit A